MKRRVLIPENAHSTRPADASLFDANACRLREEKIDFVCLDSRATKSLNHSNPVTAVTDSDNLTLVMCSYSAGSIFEFAAGSSSGEIQVDSRPSLNQANFPGRSPKFRKLEMCRKWQPTSGPVANKEFFSSIQCSKHQVLIHSQLSENGNQRVSGLPASGSTRI
ncbi:MAG: hypothetical protein LAO76_08085 [Acidobacteriia bacterium]|nr:hypothetical protein [Terriglobia bacterium]